MAAPLEANTPSEPREPYLESDQGKKGDTNVRRRYFRQICIAVKILEKGQKRDSLTRDISSLKSELDICVGLNHSSPSKAPLGKTQCGNRIEKAAHGSDTVMDDKTSAFEKNGDIENSEGIDWETERKIEHLNHVLETSKFRTRG